MNELNPERNVIKHEQELYLDQELDMQNCIEEFDQIIHYQIPEEFTSHDFDGESGPLSSEFTFNIGNGDRG